MRSEFVFVECLICIIGDYDDGVIYYFMFFQEFKQLFNLCVHVMQGIGIEIFDFVNFVFWEVCKIEWKIRFSGTEFFFKVGRNWKWDMVVLQVDVDEKGVFVFVIDLFDYFGDGQMVVDFF